MCFFFMCFFRPPEYRTDSTHHGSDRIAPQWLGFGKGGLLERGLLRKARTLELRSRLPCTDPKSGLRPEMGRKNGFGVTGKRRKKWPKMGKLAIFDAFLGQFSHFSAIFSPLSQWGQNPFFGHFFSPFRAGGLIWGLHRAIGIATLEFLENLEILEYLENPQTVENKGESDHCLEILENSEVLDILEIPPVKRPHPFVMAPFFQSGMGQNYNCQGGPE